MHNLGLHVQLVILSIIKISRWSLFGVYVLQWNLSIKATIREGNFGLYRGVLISGVDLY